MALYNSNKEVAEEIVEKYKDINKQSKGDDGCVYSGLHTNGIGCFIGCLIPDEQIKIDLDNLEFVAAIDNIYNGIYKTKPNELTSYVFEEIFNMNIIDIEFLSEVQRMHDYNDIRDAKLELDNLLRNME
jgi:hypothetical protein